MKVPQFTMFAKSAGVEIGPFEKRQEGKAREGRILLRFFRMESGAQQLRFIAEPCECFEISRMISKVYREGGKKPLPISSRAAAGRSSPSLPLKNSRELTRQATR